MLSSRTLTRAIAGAFSRPQAHAALMPKTMAPMATTTTTVRCMSNLNQQNQAAAQGSPQEGYATLEGFNLKPASPSYFTTNPVYNELLVNLDLAYRQYRPLSTPSKEQTRPNWMGKEALAKAVGVNSLKTSQHSHIITKLNQLAALTPRPPSIELLFRRYTRPEEQVSQMAKPRVVDHLGRALATGRRKEASASVYLVEGDGQVLVNGMEMTEYFKKAQDRTRLLKPFDVTDLIGKYNVWALVNGGGTTGQVEAIALGISKALITHTPELKPTLRGAGCITRDMRVVERKKPGQYKARKKFQWVKR
ncbi:37S ribosomal protein S9, mitochondrial [Lunasporangiospora selenospora]|uniref:Small ribosomal subunit protein uS9m n=1 Tax=Lunasporangiospora selenospora TaxID=979761 RepID=A0A9P6FU52_9FUNG|nr:37S ribosomal protein S9, mitochondrial [Lunasporangiospora selenospora]